MKVDETLKQEVVTACQILDREGVLDELGHFSARVPGQDLVVMNGRISPGRTTVEDLVVLDLQGNQIEGRLPPAKEIPLHLAVFQQRPDVMAVAHTHSATVVALSIARATLRAVDNLGAAVFGQEAPVFTEYGLVDNFEMAARMAEALGSSSVLVMKGHGNVVAGRSVRETCVYSVWAEKAAQLQYKAMLLGEPEWYPAADIEKVQEQMAAGKGYDRAWDYFVWRLDR